MITYYDRINVTELVCLYGAENGKVEEMDLPINKIDHHRQIELTGRDGNVLGIRRWPNDAFRGIRNQRHS